MEPNNSPYLISGKDRKELKKKIAMLKRSISLFWRWEDESKEEYEKELNSLKQELERKEKLLQLTR